ncbi:MAG: hypothetical protein KGJ82_07105 [Nitrospirota bacterium]|nr:hypothetical protein [Nitrospirota bacterium]
MLVNVPRLVTAYYTEAGGPSLPEQETENIDKIYAENFRGADHLRRIQEEARTIVGDPLVPMPERGEERALWVLPQETIGEAKEEWRNAATPH